MSIIVFNYCIFPSNEKSLIVGAKTTFPLFPKLDKGIHIKARIAIYILMCFSF